MIQQHKQTKSVWVERKFVFWYFFWNAWLFLSVGSVENLSAFEMSLSIQKKKKEVSTKFLHFVSVPLLMCIGSYDGEIIVWNNSTEKALRKLQPNAEHEDGNKQPGLTCTHKCKEMKQAMLLLQLYSLWANHLLNFTFSNHALCVVLNSKRYHDNMLN